MLSCGLVLFSDKYMLIGATSSLALSVKLTLSELVKLSLPAVPNKEKLSGCGGVVSRRVKLSENGWETLPAWSLKRTWICRYP